MSIARFLAALVLGTWTKAVSAQARVVLDRPPKLVRKPAGSFTLGAASIVY